MPLLKRKLFTLAEPPKDLKHPMILFTKFDIQKEIFQDYHDYLNHTNLYCQRVWMYKVIGKTSLTYEEVLGFRETCNR